jgi:hypothetical protein
VTPPKSVGRGRQEIQKKFLPNSAPKGAKHYRRDGAALH